MGHCNSFKCLTILTFICAGVSVAGWVLHVVGLVLFIHVSSYNLFENTGPWSLIEYTGPDSLPIWAVTVGTPFGIVAILVQALLSIYRVKNKVVIMVWSLIFPALLRFPKIFCVHLLYWIAYSTDYFSPLNYPANVIYFAGLLISTVFEEGTFILLTMLMQWKRSTTVPITSEGAINSSRPI